MLQLEKGNNTEAIDYTKPAIVNTGGSSQNVNKNPQTLPPTSIGNNKMQDKGLISNQALVTTEIEPVTDITFAEIESEGDDDEESVTVQEDELESEPREIGNNGIVTRKCKYCSQPFVVEKGRGKQLFCKPSHKTLYQREKARAANEYATEIGNITDINSPVTDSLANESVTTTSSTLAIGNTQPTELPIRQHSLSNVTDNFYSQVGETVTVNDSQPLSTVYPHSVTDSLEAAPTQSKQAQAIEIGNNPAVAESPTYQLNSKDESVTTMATPQSTFGKSVAIAKTSTQVLQVAAIGIDNTHPKKFVTDSPMSNPNNEPSSFGSSKQGESEQQVATTKLVASVTDLQPTFPQDAMLPFVIIKEMSQLVNDLCGRAEPRLAEMANLLIELEVEKASSQATEISIGNTSQSSTTSKEEAISKLSQLAIRVGEQVWLLERQTKVLLNALEAWPDLKQKVAVYQTSTIPMNEVEQEVAGQIVTTLIRVSQTKGQFEAIVTSLKGKR